MDPGHHPEGRGDVAVEGVDRRQFLEHPVPIVGSADGADGAQGLGDQAGGGGPAIARRPANVAAAGRSPVGQQALSGGIVLQGLAGFIGLALSGPLQPVEQPLGLGRGGLQVIQQVGRRQAAQRLLGLALIGPDGGGRVRSQASIHEPPVEADFAETRLNIPDKAAVGTRTAVGFGVAPGRQLRTIPVRRRRRRRWRCRCGEACRQGEGGNGGAQGHRSMITRSRPEAKGLETEAVE